VSPKRRRCNIPSLATLSYFVTPNQAEAQMELLEFDNLSNLELYLKDTTLESLLGECRARGITQKRLATMFRLPPNFLSVVKSSERKGHYFNFIGACKIACLYVLEISERTSIEQENH
jgi:hypothetical protein